MKNYLIDTHAHIDLLDNSADITLEEMRTFGVKKAIIPAVEEKTSDNIIKIAEKYEDVYAMVGLFPAETKDYNLEVEEKIINRAKSKKVVAVGEVGLDYYYDKSFVDIQQKSFIALIKIANDLDLPIVVHDREAHQDTYNILKKYNKNSKVLFHCYSGSVEFMNECIKMGWYIALGGVVTFKNAVNIKKVAIEVPLERLVLETDAPYLTPVPFRGQQNKPAYVKYVAEEIAKLKNLPFEVIADATTNNAEDFFNI